MTEGPNLLVEWSSPWQEFRSAIRPALGRSPARDELAGLTAYAKQHGLANACRVRSSSVGPSPPLMTSTSD